MMLMMMGWDVNQFLGELHCHCCEGLPFCGSQPAIIVSTMRN